MKYLVMETYHSYAVLMDEEGRFVKTANPGYEIGQTVENPVLMRSEPLEKLKKPKKVIRALTMIAAVLALFFGVNYYQNNYQTDSSIYMAINPEVQMLLNKKGEVFEVKGRNIDGKKLVNNFEKTSSDKSVISNELIDLAVEMGFLSDGGRVSIGIDAADQETFKEYGIELRKALEGRESIVIEITDLEGMKQTEEKSESESEVEKVTEPKTEVNPEPKPEPKTQPELKSEPESEKVTFISKNKVKAIAFQHAGVNERDVDIDSIELNKDDEPAYYEIEFEVDDDEYDYEIHALTGNILDYDQDIDDDNDSDSDDDDDD